jgi:O-antigen/teichoic acid export membrane protein
MAGVTRGGAGLLRNIASGWVVLAANVAYGLIITPFVVAALRPEGYGVWSVLNGLFAYSELFYFGLGSALIRYTAQAISRGDEHTLDRLVSVVLTIYVLIGAGCVAISLLLAPSVHLLFAAPLAPHLYRTTEIVCKLLGVRLLLLFVASGFSGLIVGHDRFDVTNAVALASTAVRCVVVPLSLRSANPLLSLGVTMTIIAVLEAAALVFAAYRVRPGLHVRATRPHSRELSVLYSFGLQSFAVTFANRLIMQTDSVVIGVMIGASSVAVYTLSQALIDYARMAIGRVSGILLPRMVHLAELKDDVAMGRAYLRVTQYGGLVAGVLTGSLIGIGPAFLNLWVGPEYADPSRRIVVPLSLALLLNVYSVQLPLSIYQALGLMRMPATVLGIEAVLNVMLSVLLAPRFGLAGVALGTLLPAALVSAVVLPTYLCRRLSVSAHSYIRCGVAPGLVAAVCGIAWYMVAANVIVYISYDRLLAAAIIGATISFAAGYAALGREDRLLIKELVRSLRGIFDQSVRVEP